MPIRTLPLLLVALLSCLPARANSVDAKPVAPEELGMPAREKEFIAIFTEIRRRYASETHATKRTALEILLEQRIAAFMRAGQDVQGWIGVVENHGMADREHAWIAIRIAPELTVSTLRSVAQDSGYQTLIPKYSPMSTLLNRDIMMGQAVVFDASMLIFDVPDDHSPVETSKLIARFWKLRAIEDRPHH